MATFLRGVRPMIEESAKQMVLSYMDKFTQVFEEKVLQNGIPTMLISAMNEEMMDLFRDKMIAKVDEVLKSANASVALRSDSNDPTLHDDAAAAAAIQKGGHRASVRTKKRLIKQNLHTAATRKKHVVSLPSGDFADRPQGVKQNRQSGGTSPQPHGVVPTATITEPKLITPIITEFNGVIPTAAGTNNVSSPEAPTATGTNNVSSPAAPSAIGDFVERPQGVKQNAPNNISGLLSAAAAGTALPSPSAPLAGAMGKILNSVGSSDGFMDAITGQVSEALKTVVECVLNKQMNNMNMTKIMEEFLEKLDVQMLQQLKTKIEDARPRNNNASSFASLPARDPQNLQPGA